MQADFVGEILLQTDFFLFNLAFNLDDFYAAVNAYLIRVVALGEGEELVVVADVWAVFANTYHYVFAFELTDCARQAEERESFVKQMEMKKFEKDLYFDFREHIDDKHEGDIEFEPDADGCLQYLEEAYLRSDVYFALVDSAAAEQGARRTAMKSATDNATEMIATLTRIYNRERQGAITTEISEIVGGAAALEE